ncbi:hypothetical protein EDD18DRAFT_1107514 [Armillaria luteobubalina]|uniref:Uncharacterized protein n=1 Tax=Armillaria luteobubalina TaxID=153913 RepID=A0AA39TLI4_9AGAR|nr:hypothetical protein EDD18DRAFT_1107514 [Armillaria luteobubalina]
MDNAEFIVSRHEWNESIVRTGPLPIPDIIDYFISLSRLQPLKVTILLSGIPQQPSSFRKLQVEWLGALLFYNANRVTSLTIRGMNWVHQYKILKRLSGKHMPILATFNCDHGSGQNTTPPIFYTAPIPFLPFSASPGHMSNIHPNCLGSLQRSQFDDPGILICQQTISEAKDRLRHPFPMPKLEDLHIRYEDPMEVQNLIIGIAFPELKQLNLVSLDRTEEQGVSIIHMFLALVQALPLQQLISLKLHGVLLPVSLTEMPSISHEGHDGAGKFSTQMEDNFSGEGSEGDDNEHEEEVEPYELPFHLSVSDGWKVFDESVRSELTVVFFQSLKALRTLDVSEPDRATSGFLHEAMPDSSLTNGRLGVHTLTIEENVQSPENVRLLTSALSHGSLSSSLLPGFHDAISAANHSRHYSSQDHRSVYNLLLDIGRCANENEEMLSSLLPRLHGSIECKSLPPPLVAKPFAFLLTYFIEPLESLWRKDDFLWGGELVPDMISPMMLVTLANWEALLMETRLVLANLERLVDKMVGDLDVVIGLQYAAIHIEKNIQLSRRSSAPLDSCLKLMALASKTGLLEVVALFNVRSPQHLTHIIKIMCVLVQEMERVPRHATSAWMVSTEEEISRLKKTIDKEILPWSTNETSRKFFYLKWYFCTQTLAHQKIPIVRPSKPASKNTHCPSKNLKHIPLMEGYQQDTATDLEPSDVELILSMPEVPWDILREIFGHVVLDLNSVPYALIKTASLLSPILICGATFICMQDTASEFNIRNIFSTYISNSSKECGISIMLDFGPFFQHLSPAISTQLRSQASCWAEVFILCLHPSDIYDLLSPLPNGVSLECLNTLTGVSLNMVDFQFFNRQKSRELFPMDILLSASRLCTLHAEVFEPDLYDDTPKSWDVPERYVLSSVCDLVLVPDFKPDQLDTLLTIHEIDPLSSTTRDGFPINRRLFQELLYDSFLPNLTSIDLDWHESENARIYESLLTQVVQFRELQKIRQYSHVDHIEGEWYSFENDFIPCFKTALMDLEEDESEYDEMKEITELAAELLEEVIEF